MTDARRLHVTMPDGSVWAVPVQAVIDHRLSYYRDLGKADRSDDHPSDYVIIDWAASNMNWDDVAAVATKVKDRAPMTPADMQDGWVNGAKVIQ